MLVGAYLPVLIFDALGQVVPDRVLAAGGSPHWGINQSGIDNSGKPTANMLSFNGGMGASHLDDGPNVVSWPTDASCVLVEISEQITPLRIRHKRMRANSDGPGRFRGGVDQEILFESRDKDAIAVSFLAGGRRAHRARSASTARRSIPSANVLRRGETVLLATPGGGGHGDPRTRDREAVARDLTEGYVTDASPYV